MENIFSFDVFLINVPIYLAFILAGYMLSIKPKYVAKSNKESFHDELYEQNDLKIESAEDFAIYMQLANLARKNGEFNKAVKIHSNLLTNGSLPKNSQTLLLLELGKDYLASGLFDKAEENLLNSLKMTEKNSDEYKDCLLEISKLYERQVNWKEALAYREKLAKLDKNHKRSAALLMCNLAKEEIKDKNIGNAKKYYQSALNHDEKCVLAIKELANIYINEDDIESLFNLIENYTNHSYKLVNLLSFALQKLLEIEEYKTKTADLIKNITKAEHKHYEISILYCGYLFKENKIDELNEVIAQYNDSYKNNLQAIYEMAKFLKDSGFEYKVKDDNNILFDKVENMLEKSYNYQCSKCGYHTKQEFWHCPQCQEWDTLDRIHR